MGLQNPAGRAHSAPPDSLAGFKGSYFYRKGRREKGKGGERGDGKGRKGGGGASWFFLGGRGGWTP